MDDLISRQSTIEAFKEEFFGMYSDDFKYMIKWLEKLPNAEPEIIHCKECVYYEYKNEYSGLCDMGGEWAPDDYCSYGRRYKKDV